MIPRNDNELSAPRGLVSRRGFLGSAAAAAATATVVGPGSARAAAATASVSAASPLRGPVRTESGLVSGATALLPDVTAFKGIPYGAPTDGANRWRPPQPRASWTGVFKADRWGDMCPQDTSLTGIAAFGGDPDRVTLAGQSAGAAMVFDLVCSPLARGLFHRAQADSGVNYPKDPNLTWLAPKYLTLDQAEAKGTAVMKDLDVTTTAQLRAVAASDLLTHTNDIGEYTLDRYVFPKTYTETLATGAQIDVPFLTGNNKDESRATPGQNVELATYTANAQSTYGAMAEEFLDLYPAADATEAGEQTNESIRDDERVSTFLWGRQWSAHATSPVYNYYWTHTPPGQESQGASHGSELNYTFANLYATDLAWTDTDRKIADTLSDYVVNFATTGNPNDAGLPRWRPLDPADPGVMEIGDSFERIPLAPTEAKLDFFERYFASQTQEW